MTPYAGWHLAAFADELTGEVTPMHIGDRPLVAVRRGGRIRVYDATCPHRGAHLGYGGRLDRDCLLCPFHGRRVHLGADAPGEYKVAEHPAVHVGEALFVCLDDGPDLGFAMTIAGLLRSHRVVAGYRTPVCVDGEIIVENAFDPEHFAPVHGILRVPDMAPALGEDGELVVESELTAPSTNDAVTRYRFFARAFSPNLVVTQLGPAGPSPYYFTGTTPTAEGCVARVAIGVPNGPDGRPAARPLVDSLIAGAREAFREDMPVWEHLAPGHVPQYDARDKAVMAFRDFVETFRR